jgi:hypothetical protein
MTHTKHAHLPSTGRHKNDDSNLPYWKRAHHDWRFWIALSLMLIAMFVYIATGDLAIQPNDQNHMKMGQPTP